VEVEREAGPGLSLQGCVVTTRAVLNFREGPTGTIKGLMPAQAALTALQISKVKNRPEKSQSSQIDAVESSRNRGDLSVWQ